MFMNDTEENNELGNHTIRSQVHWQKTKDDLIFDSMKSPFALFFAFGCAGAYFWVAWSNGSSMAIYLGIFGLLIGFGVGMGVSIALQVIRKIFIEKAASKAKKSSKKKFTVWVGLILGFAIINLLIEFF